jgi:hypothetical protein
LHYGNLSYPNKGYDSNNFGKTFARTDDRNRDSRNSTLYQGVCPINERKVWTLSPAIFYDWNRLGFFVESDIALSFGDTLKILEDSFHISNFSLPSSSIFSALKIQLLNSKISDQHWQKLGSTLFGSNDLQKIICQNAVSANL